MQQVKCPKCRQMVDTYWSGTDEVVKVCTHFHNGVKCPYRRVPVKTVKARR